ncbi:MAG: hypothetical protein AB8B96_21085 [Lysobacterales bacterium]
MSRAWVEFIQSQNLDWETSTLPTLSEGPEIKRLSQDPDNGALSALLRYPAGYQAAAMPLTADEEFLVLDGDLEIGGRSFGPFAYGHWPSGYNAGARSSQSGAIVLTFFSSHPAASQTSDFRTDRLVEHCNAFDVPYTGKFHPEFPPGAGRKLLYTDPVTQEATWILGTLPMRWAERSEIHPVVEEMYLLSGESHGDRGVMRPGAYFWRPGEIPHGPYGTLTGNLYFFRTKDGGLQTQYVEPRAPFHWWPKYDPVLPEPMKPFGGEVDTLTRCW